MKLIVRHGSTIPTVNDISDRQLSYCSDDKSLYIRIKDDIRKIDNSIIDEKSFYQYSDKTYESTTNMVQIINIAPNLTLSIRFYVSQTPQLVFALTNMAEQSKTVTIHNAKIAVIKTTPDKTEFDIGIPDDVTIEGAGGKAEYQCSAFTTIDGDQTFEGLAKFDATNVRFKITSFKEDGSSKMHIALSGNVSYGSVDKIFRYEEQE